MTNAELIAEYRHRSLEPMGAAYAQAAALLSQAEELGRIAIWLKYLGTGDAATTMGAIEYLASIAKEVADALDRIADAIDRLADATL